MGKKYFIVTFNSKNMFPSDELIIRAYSEEDIYAYFKEADGTHRDDLTILETSLMELTDGVLHEEEEA